MLPLAAPALAAAPAAPAPDTADAPTTVEKKPIIVYGSRVKGQVQAAQAPILTLDEEDITSYGAASITDLLDDISAETNSGRGRSSSGPVILVNGQRISSFREIHDYPPEAIKKIEVLPEEVALRYGYAPDQRVVNIILKDHFFIHSLGAQFTAPQAGGTATEKGDVGLVRIANARRMNITLRADHTSALTEAERNVTQAAGTTSSVAGDPSPASARTLTARTTDYSLNANYTLPLAKAPGSGTLSVNLNPTHTDSTGLSGLNTVTLGEALRTLPGALARNTRSDTLQAGATLNKPLGDWQLTATVDGGRSWATSDIQNHAETSAITDAYTRGQITADGALPAVAPGNFTRTQTITDTMTSLATFMGRPLSLPGGDLAVTAKAGFAYSAQAAGSSLGAASNLKRGDASFGGNLAIPITSRREDFGAALGDITLNASGGADRLSDAGWLSNWSGGVTWGVTPALSLQASYIFNQTAPSLANLGSPQTSTFNVPVYDYITGKTANATILSGGNPALTPEDMRDIKLALNWALPITGKRLTSANLVVEYFSNLSTNITSSFPTLTAAVQGAFTNRITRDANGDITAIDETPVLLARQRETRLRWGFNFSGNLGKQVTSRGRMGLFGGHGGPPPGGGFGGGVGGGVGGGMGREGREGGMNGAGGPPPAGGPGGAPPRGPRYEGRWNVSLYHTVQLIDRVQLASGGASLDLLNGDAISGSGGVARHTLELDAGGFYKGLGLRANGSWTGATHVNGGASDGSGNLRFGALLKVNLRAFLDFNQKPQLIEKLPFLKGARLSLMANNLFDQIQKVTQANGTTPQAYQPAYMDANGRVLGIELRKMF